MQQTKQSNGVGLALHRRGGEGEGGGSIAKQATGRRAKSSAATHPPPPCLLRLGRAHRWGRWRSEARRDPPLRGEPFVPTSRCPRVWRYSPPRRRHAPSGAKERGREGSRGWEGGRCVSLQDARASLTSTAAPSPHHFTAPAPGTCVERAPIYLTQGKGAPCATTRRAVQDARVPLTSTAIAPNSDVHRALAAL